MSVGHGGLYHSQSPEGYFLGASGLKVGLSSFMVLRVINLLFRLLSLVRRFKPRVFSLAQSETLIPCFSWSRRFSTVLQVRTLAHEYITIYLFSRMFCSGTSSRRRLWAPSWLGWSSVPRLRSHSPVLGHTPLPLWNSSFSPLFSTSSSVRPCPAFTPYG